MKLVNNGASHAVSRSQRKQRINFKLALIFLLKKTMGVLYITENVMELGRHVEYINRD